MGHIHSFQPIADRNAMALILGSMPGRASLAAKQYYAHPQNAFWRIMSELLQFDPNAAYPARIQLLKSARIALWDVLQSCSREGSLDAMIESDTEVPNNFHSFLQSHKQITHIFFNGAKAEASFNRHVLRHINIRPLSYARLPSTSPANSAMSFARKADLWRLILGPNQQSHMRPDGEQG